MNNEEKILTMLEKMQGQINEMQGQIGNMQGQIGDMQGEISTIKTSQAAMQETLTRVAITQENVVLPRIQLLAEGQTTILDKMPSKSRIEALEEDVSTLKAIIKFHAADIAELKAAK